MNEGRVGDGILAKIGEISGEMREGIGEVEE